MTRPRDSVIVLGAGVAGMATAYALARRGASVTIIDRASEPAQGASFANGGQLSYAYTDALASPSLLARLPMLVLGADPAFRVHWRADPAMLRWGIAFLRNCTTARFETNTLAMLRLALESRLAMQALLERHPLKFAHRVAGKLHLYEDRDAFASARALVALKAAGGARQRLLTPGEAIAVEPALASLRDRLAGAVHSPDDEIGDPYLFCRALLPILTDAYGVRTVFDRPIDRIDPGGAQPRLIGTDGTVMAAPTIVLCSGIGTVRLLRGTGIAAPIWPMKGYSFTAAPGAAAPQVSITDVARKLVFCNLDGRMRVAGLADLGRSTVTVEPRRFAALVGAAHTSLPDAIDRREPIERWAGIRPMTPNGLPLIAAPRAGLVLNTGHGALGWTAAMGAGERAAELIMERAPRSP